MYEKVLALAIDFSACQIVKGDTEINITVIDCYETDDDFIPCPVDSYKLKQLINFLRKSCNYCKGYCFQFDKFLVSVTFLSEILTEED